MSRSLRVMALVFLCYLPASARAELPTAQDVLDNWASAVGGRERIDGIETMETSSIVSMFGLEGTIRQRMSQPDRYLLELELGDIFGITQLATGGRAWMKDQNGHTAEVAGKDRADLLATAFLENLSHLRSGTPPALVTNVDVEAGTGLLAVTLEPPQATKMVYFLDQETWLPVRVESVGVSGETLVVTLSQWERHDGLLVPMRIHQSTGEPQNDVALTATAVSLNPKWPQDPFRALTEDESISAVQDPRLAASIPITLRGVHIMVEVMVNGQGPFEFIYDTGASITVLDKSLAASLGIEAQGELAGGGVGENKADVALAAGVTFAMPGVEVSDQTIALLDNRGLLEERFGARIDGIIGFGFISRFVTEIDYAASRMGLHDPETFQYDGTGTIVPMAIDGSTPHVEATVRGFDAEPVLGTFLIDTGSGSGVSLTGPFAQRIGIVATMPRTLKHVGGFGVGGVSTSLVGRAQSLEMEGLVFDEPVVRVSQDEGGAGADETRAGLIGGRILSRCRVFLDYPGSRMILEPNGRFADRFRWNNSGLTLVTGGRDDFHRFEIAHIDPGSPAEAAGLRPKDVLLRIDGRDATEWNIGSLGEFFRVEARDVTVELERDGKRRSVTLELREPL